MKNRFWQWIRWAGVVGAVWLGFRLVLPLMLPFLLGLGLAVLAEPLVGFLHRRRVPRGVCAGIGVTMAFCGIGILLLLLGALAVREVGRLSGVMPQLEQAARGGMTLLQRRLLELAQKMPGTLGRLLGENVTELFSDGTALVEQGGKFLLGLAGNFLSRVPDSALTLGTGLISAYLISAKLPQLKKWGNRLLPREKLRALLDGFLRLRQVLGGWLLAQVKIMGVTLVLLMLGFRLLRISYGVVWALVVALVDALPVLGTGTVLLPWAAVCLLQGDMPRAVGMAGLYVTISLTRSMLEPKLLGRQLGLDPLVTLMAIYAGYKLWGFGGMILAPMLAVTATQLLPKPSEGG